MDFQDTYEDAIVVPMPNEDYIEEPKLEDDRDVDIKLEPGSSRYNILQLKLL